MKVRVKLNSKEGPYFQSYKGVRKGDPLSPILFNLVADSLTRMVHVAQQNGLIKGLARNLIPNRVAVLQYADDTILCLEHCENNARNVKLLLYVYEQMSRLEINFSKSEVVSINGDTWGYLYHLEDTMWWTEVIWKKKHTRKLKTGKGVPCPWVGESS